MSSSGKTVLKIRPTLIIGLGGTGYRIALELKARLEEQLGEASGYRSVMKFLCVDTAEENRSTVQPNHPEKRVMLSRDTEFMRISDVPLSDLLNSRQTNPAIAAILPERMRSTHLDQGAQQIRRLGRIALFFHYSAIRHRLATLMDELHSVDSGKFLGETSEGFHLQIGNNRTPRVIVVGSICGGTGSGTFIDIAYLVRHIGFVQGAVNSPRQLEVMGMLLLPEAFPEINTTGADRIRANAYAALLDLEYYNQATSQNTILYQVNFPKETVSVEGGPFTICYLVNGRGQAGAVRGMNQLSRVLADSLMLMIGSRTGEQLEGTLDNIKADLSIYQGGYRAFYSALGMSQIIYPALALRERFGLELKLRLIREDILRGVADPVTIHENAIKWFRQQVDVFPEPSDVVSISSLVRPLEILTIETTTRDPLRLVRARYEEVRRDIRERYEMPWQNSLEVWRSTLDKGLQTQVYQLVNQGLSPIGRTDSSRFYAVSTLEDAYRQFSRHFERDFPLLLNRTLNVPSEAHAAHETVTYLASTTLLPETQTYLERLYNNFVEYAQETSERYLTAQAASETDEAPTPVSVPSSRRRPFEEEGGFQAALMWLTELDNDLRDSLSQSIDERRDAEILNEVLTQEGFELPFLGEVRRARRAKGMLQAYLIDDLPPLVKSEIERKLILHVRGKIQELRQQVEVSLGFWQLERRRTETLLKQYSANTDIYYTPVTHFALSPAQITRTLKAALEQALRFDQHANLLQKAEDAMGSLIETLIPSRQVDSAARLLAFCQEKFDEYAADRASVTGHLANQKLTASDEYAALLSSMGNQAEPLLTYSRGRATPAQIKVLGTLTAAEGDILLPSIGKNTTDASVVETNDPLRVSFIVTHHGIPLNALSGFESYRQQYLALMQKPDSMFHINPQLERLPYDPGSRYFINPNDVEAKVARALAYGWLRFEEYEIGDNKRHVFMLNSALRDKLEKRLDIEVEQQRKRDLEQGALHASSRIALLELYKDTLKESFYLTSDERVYPILDPSLISDRSTYKPYMTSLKQLLDTLMGGPLRIYSLIFSEAFTALYDETFGRAKASLDSAPVPEKPIRRTKVTKAAPPAPINDERLLIQRFLEQRGWPRDQKGSQESGRWLSKPSDPDYFIEERLCELLDAYLMLIDKIRHAQERLPPGYYGLASSTPEETL